MWILPGFVTLLTLSASAQQPCVTSAPQVVDDLYQHILERSADPASSGLSQGLASGELNVRDVVSILAHSSEYATRFFWPPIVAESYRQILERQPTTDEVRTATTALSAGELSPEALVADLATRAANTDSEAIRIIYRRLLGREPDPEGLRAYTQLAERDGLSAVSRNIVTSQEYRARAASNQPAMNAYGQAVRAIYSHLLNREADPEGLRSMSELASVYGPKGPIDRILNSAEYRDKYGTHGIPGRDGATFCPVTPPTRTAVPRR